MCSVCSVSPMAGVNSRGRWWQVQSRPNCESHRFLTASMRAASEASPTRCDRSRSASPTRSDSSQPRSSAACLTTDDMYLLTSTLQPIAATDVTKDCAATEVPLLIRGSAGRFCTDCERWSLSSLIGYDRVWTVNAWDENADTTMDLPTYLGHVRGTPSDREPLYLFENELPQSLTTTLRLPDDFGRRDLFGEIGKELAEGSTGGEGSRGGGEPRGDDDGEKESIESLLSERAWLLVGGPTSGTRWHFDPHGVSAWSSVFSGRKLWLFWPSPDGMVCAWEGSKSRGSALEARF